MATSRRHGLRNYIIRRLMLMVPTFLGITFVTFVLTQFVPGGPIDQLRLQMIGAGGEGGSTGGARDRVQFVIPEDQLAILKRFYGFDKPIPVRYLVWLGRIVRLDFGASFRYTEPVIDTISQRLPVSIYYGLWTTFFTYAISIPLGIVKAIRHRSLIDNASSVLIFVGYAIPGYALGAVLLVLFAVNRSWFPLGGFESAGFDSLPFWGKVWDRLHHSILPLICYLIGSFAVTTMLMKNSLMENMSADYVKTALAKGLTWRRAIFVHAVRNSLIPLATSIGHLIGLILTGSLLIERVFNIRGMGLLYFEAIQARDYPVVMGIIVISGVLLLVGNLLSDLCVAAVDPRVRFE
ncbi:MAG: Inner membrane ABC transporter permease protein YejB [candidate division BRC1 bacterium ADurb.BinA292]|nr:MAG: Inner membrane ABC transporter permease protein YejB [candidate division BRC1 bacterium ADurb.BinA292]